MAADVEPRVKALERSVATLTRTTEDQAKSLQGVDTLQKQITDLKKQLDDLQKLVANKVDKKTVGELAADEEKKRRASEKEQELAMQKEMKLQMKEVQKIIDASQKEMEKANLQGQLTVLAARIGVLEAGRR